MSTMVRKQIYIEAQQEAALKHITKERQISEAEIIRQAIARWLEEDERARRTTELWEEEQAFIEALLAQGPVPGGRTWTRDAIYEDRGCAF
jgi:hypothetical protein